MSHWIIVPLVLPALTAAFLVLVLRRHLDWQRRVSVLSSLVLLGVAVGLVWLTGDGEIRPYRVGAWPAPFGIVLVLDRLSALMLLLSGVLVLAVAIQACFGLDERGRHFHPLLHFQALGINGAFLTGDVFNLFVFFEVLLIASYGLLLHGGGRARLKAGFQYVAVNLVGSTLFLVAVGLIYAVTGTLNMADLAVKASLVNPADAAILRVGVLLLLLVFALKAALAPLHLWLPTAYAVAPAPVAALFAILTKVGAYAILRVHGLVFGPHAGDIVSTASTLIVPAALVTLVIGALGVLASRRLTELVAFAVVWSMGSLLVAVGAFDRQSVAAALYYAVHSTLAAAALFLVADLVTERRGRVLDRLRPAAPVRNLGVIGTLFFLSAVAMAGLPPLSGFIGKLLVLRATWTSSAGAWIWTVVLGTSLIVILAFARAGSTLFWKTPPDLDRSPIGPLRASPVPMLVAGCLVAATAALAIFAQPVMDNFEAAAMQILDPTDYVRAVLGDAPTAFARR